MFDIFRNNMKVLMALLILLIVPSFVLFGVDGYMKMMDNSEVVAEFQGGQITRPEWDNAHRREMESLSARLPGVDRKMYDNAESRMATLERLLNERLLDAVAKDKRLITPDARLARELANDPNIARLKKADGTLDVEAYRQLVAQQGLTPEGFEQSVRVGLARQQVLDGVTQSAWTSDKLAQLALSAYFERREVQVQRFEATAFLSQVKPTDEQVQAFYKENAERFRSQEKVDVSYAVLDAADLASQVRISDAELKAYFEQNQSALSNEQRRVRHILLELPADAVEKDKVKAHAASLVATLRKDASQFAKLAKEESKDPGSADNGGDLNFFGRGAMVPAFEKAAFALALNQISDPVETEFGLHILQVTDIKRDNAKGFEQMKGELMATLQAQQAQKLFAEKAEAFTNTVYEQSTSFDEVVKLGAKVNSFTGLTRVPAANVPTDLKDPKVLAKVFDANVLQSKANSDAFEIGKNRLMAVRVTKHDPATVQPLEAVMPEVKAALSMKQAFELAKAKGNALVKAAQAGQPTDFAGKTMLLSRTDTQGLPADWVQEVLSAPVTKGKSSWLGVSQTNQVFAVVKVNQVLAPSELKPEQKQQYVNQIMKLEANGLAKAYLESLKVIYKAKVTAKSA